MFAIQPIFYLLRMAISKAYSASDSSFGRLARTQAGLHSCPEGPSTQYFRSLVPNTIISMVVGTRNLRYWVLGPLGWFQVLGSGFLLRTEPWPHRENRSLNFRS